MAFSTCLTWKLFETFFTIEYDLVKEKKTIIFALLVLSLIQTTSSLNCALEIHFLFEFYRIDVFFSILYFYWFKLIRVVFHSPKLSSLANKFNAHFQTSLAILVYDQKNKQSNKHFINKVIIIRMLWKNECRLFFWKWSWRSINKNTCNVFHIESHCNFCFVNSI